MVCIYIHAIPTEMHLLGLRFTCHNLFALFFDKWGKKLSPRIQHASVLCKQKVMNYEQNMHKSSQNILNVLGIKQLSVQYGVTGNYWRHFLKLMQRIGWNMHEYIRGNLYTLLSTHYNIFLGFIFLCDISRIFGSHLSPQWLFAYK